MRITMYKESSEISVDIEQVPTMEQTGWSRNQAPVVETSVNSTPIEETVTTKVEDTGDVVDDSMVPFGPDSDAAPRRRVVKKSA